MSSTANKLKPDWSGLSPFADLPLLFDDLAYFLFDTCWIRGEQFSDELLSSLIRLRACVFNG
jgi:hypothetical protein